MAGLTDPPSRNTPRPHRFFLPTSTFLIQTRQHPAERVAPTGLALADRHQGAFAPRLSPPTSPHFACILTTSHADSPPLPKTSLDQTEPADTPNLHGSCSASCTSATRLVTPPLNISEHATRRLRTMADHHLSMPYHADIPGHALSKTGQLWPTRRAGPSACLAKPNLTDSPAHPVTARSLTHSQRLVFAVLPLSARV